MSFCEYRKYSNFDFDFYIKTEIMVTLSLISHFKMGYFFSRKIVDIWLFEKLICLPFFKFMTPPHTIWQINPLIILIFHRNLIFQLEGQLYCVRKGYFFLPLFAIWIPPIYSMLNKIYDLSNNSFVDREFFSLIFLKKNRYWLPCKIGTQIVLFLNIITMSDFK